MPHVPDTVPGKRVTGAGARKEGREASRQTSEVGAVCGQAARTVLCGGRPVMGVPTAIVRCRLADRREDRDIACVEVRSTDDAKWHDVGSHQLRRGAKSRKPNPMRAEPEVRVHLPPAVSQQTCGPCSRAPPAPRQIELTTARDAVTHDERSVPRRSVARFSVAQDGQMGDPVLTTTRNPGNVS